jgi:group I intron endonuclease
MKHFVYITTNIINGKQYVGDHSTDNLNDTYLGSGKPYFQKAIRKYGRKNFKKEILEYFNTKEEAFNAQEKYIQEYNTLSPNGYNISPKGGYGISKSYLSEETKRKISESHLGKKCKEETKIKIGKIHSGKILSEETKRKISEALKGNKIWLGKHHTIKTKNKISNSLKIYNQN